MKNAYFCVVKPDVSDEYNALSLYVHKLDHCFWCGYNPPIRLQITGLRLNRELIEWNSKKIRFKINNHQKV
jgi:hypothetical protein